jgi:hypothetical protein
MGKERSMKNKSKLDEFLKIYTIWESRRLGLNINYSILVDTSGSMSETDDVNISRIDHAKNAVRNIINNLHSEQRRDIGTIYTFNDTLTLKEKSRKKSTLLGCLEKIDYKENAVTSLWDSIGNILLKFGEKKKYSF